MRQLFLFILCSLSTLLLSGCTSSGAALSKTMKLAFFGSDTNEISVQKIQSSPYANILVQEDDSAPALLVLVWAEATQHEKNALIPPALKWLSSNKELIVTRGGRIIKTVNLGHGNITQLRANKPDPLVLGLQKSTTPKQWHYQLSWQPDNHHRYQATSSFKRLGTTSIKTPTNGQQTVLAFSEHVTIARIGQSYTNYYWVNPQSGHVVKSQQHLAPTLPVLTITEAKPFVAGY
ncbi:MAG: YjbF family lipoprotein [Vibrio sp.]